MVARGEGSVAADDDGLFLRLMPITAALSALPGVAAIPFILLNLIIAPHWVGRPPPKQNTHLRHLRFP